VVIVKAPVVLHVWDALGNAKAVMDVVDVLNRVLVNVLAALKQVLVPDAVQIVHPVLVHVDVHV